MSRSLCSVDGSLLIPADKSSLMQVIEGKSADGVPEGTPCEMVDAEEPLLKILVVDAMGVLQSTCHDDTGPLGSGFCETDWGNDDRTQCWTNSI